MHQNYLNGARLSWDFPGGYLDLRVRQQGHECAWKNTHPGEFWDNIRDIMFEVWRLKGVISEDSAGLYKTLRPEANGFNLTVAGLLPINLN